MSKFRYEDDTLIADHDAGDISYDEALAIAVDTATADIECTLWELVDDLEYIIGEEYAVPTNEDDDEPLTFKGEDGRD